MPDSQRQSSLQCRGLHREAKARPCSLPECSRPASSARTRTASRHVPHRSHSTLPVSRPLFVWEGTWPSSSLTRACQELSVWRKQATISVQDEFAGRSLPAGREDSHTPEQEEQNERTRNGVRRSAELYINICNIMDRLVKRSEGVAADHARIALSLQSLTETSTDTYATDNTDVPLLNDGLVAMSKHLRQGQSLMEDEARAWDEGVLEDLKRQRDALVSVRDLFDRRERLDRDNIPYLERRIQCNETKLANLRANPEGLVKPGEIEKVVEAIIKVCHFDPNPPRKTTNTHALRPCRIKSPSSASTTGPYSSKSASAMSSSPSRPRSITSLGGTRTGLRRGSSTPSS